MNKTAVVTNFGIKDHLASLCNFNIHFADDIKHKAGYKKEVGCYRQCPGVHCKVGADIISKKDEKKYRCYNIDMYLQNLKIHIQPFMLLFIGLSVKIFFQKIYGFYTEHYSGEHPFSGGPALGLYF